MIINFDYRVLGFLFFIWAWLNFIDGLNNAILHPDSMSIALLNIAKGIIGLIIAGYMYYSGDTVIITHKN